MPRISKLEDLNVAAREEDVKTLDGILNAFYEIVSGPAGEKRNWDRDRTLYVPGALFVPASMKNSHPAIAVMDHEAYIERSDPIVREGFFEYEIHRVTRIFGNIAHVFSTYEGKRTQDGPVFLRGVNSIELVNDGKRWWIVAAQWDTEREGNAIPAEYLPREERK